MEPWIINVEISTSTDYTLPLGRSGLIFYHPGYESKMGEFMRLRPATFDHTDEDPLVADDWLRAINKKLEVVNANDQEKVVLASH